MSSPSSTTFTCEIKRHCTYESEVSWWPQNARHLNPNFDSTATSISLNINPCNIHMRGIELRENNLRFYDMSKKDQILTTKFYLQENVHHITEAKLFKTCSPSNSSTPNIETLPMLFFNLPCPGELQTFQLMQLLQKPIAFVDFHPGLQNSSTPNSSTRPESRNEESPNHRALQCKQCDGYDWSTPTDSPTYNFHPEFCQFCLKTSRYLTERHFCILHTTTVCENGSCSICKRICLSCVHDGPVEGNCKEAIIHNCSLCKKNYARYEKMIEYICEPCVKCLIGMSDSNSSKSE